ncbi:hypothetical protein PsYK624_109270 [Phanerochaete sordida]|uniref:Uncharacterized protein n=1 Tax=Phanerochaete sordida TaxID=48140 RepID=A0A9P3GJJ5_9APHY|nr:hypothetical protein PsYK624_109270 [Phanerochaete sordida]
MCTTSRCQDMSKSAPARTTRACSALRRAARPFRCTRRSRTSRTMAPHSGLHQDLECRDGFGAVACRSQTCSRRSPSQSPMRSTRSRDSYTKGSAPNNARHDRTYAVPASEPRLMFGAPGVAAASNGNSQRNTAWSLRTRARSSTRTPSTVPLAGSTHTRSITPCRTPALLPSHVGGPSGSLARPRPSCTLASSTSLSRLKSPAINATGGNTSTRSARSAPPTFIVTHSTSSCCTDVSRSRGLACRHRACTYTRTRVVAEYPRHKKLR